MTTFRSTSSAPARSIGFWMAVVMGLLQAFYAGRAFLDPEAFSIYRGMALAAAADAHWVQTYASRTLFVALVVGFLLARGDLVSLKWVALLGVVMPLSDAILAVQTGASTEIVLRHVATVAYLLVTFGALHRYTQRRVSPSLATPGG